MIAHVQLTLRGSLDQLRIVWQTGETLLESVRFEEDPECSRYNVLLAVQEMLTNVLRHAYDGDESSPIVVAFDINNREVSVVMRDCGPEFNPVAVGFDPGEEHDPAEGGYGIMITKVVMDDLSYRREGDWNVLRITKSVRSTSTVPKG